MHLVTEENARKKYLKARGILDIHRWTRTIPDRMGIAEIGSSTCNWLELTVAPPPQDAHSLRPCAHFPENGENHRKMGVTHRIMPAFPRGH